MNFINPIEILELQNHSVSEIDNPMIKKAKRRLFANINLSDDGLLNYKGIYLTKSDCETVIGDLENPEYLKFYLYLANVNRPLNDFLVNGDERFFSKFSEESIYKLPEFVNFISPYFPERFDKELFKSFKNRNFTKVWNILQTQNLINSTDKNTAFKSTSIEISENIKKVEDITNKIKNNETSWTATTIPGLLSHVQIWTPVNILNLLPKYFQSQINKTAAAINQLQLAIWKNLYNPSACKQLLEHLLALNIESVWKKTFEDNYRVVRKADERKNLLDKLYKIIGSFENNAKTITNARQLIYQTKPFLFSIKSISQGNDDTYISLSTRVASIAQNFVIDEVNKSESINNNFADLLGFPIIKAVLENAWEVVQLIGSLEVQNEFKVNRYNPYKEILRNMCRKFNVATPQFVFGKIPQCNFIIIDGAITHTDKDCKPLPVTTPLIRGNIRYIGLDLTIEAFENQSVKFDLKYIQPNGTVKIGTSSPEGFSFSKDKVIDTNTKIINFLGGGNSGKGIYTVGTHHIEVWIDNCMIYRKSFEVDWSAEEKAENAKREAEKRERERIEAEKRKEQAKIAKQKAKDKKVRNICLLIMGIFIGLAVLFTIWGTVGIYIAVVISFILYSIIKN